MNGTNKRGRGRPHGTGLNDEKTLGQIADLIACNPSLRPTTAIKRTLHNPDSATIRRLQVKWKAQGEGFLARARERRKVEAAARPTSGGINYGKLAMMSSALRNMGGLGGHSAIFDALNSPALRAMDSPAMRAIQAMENSSTMRAIRAMENRPTMRIMREMDRINRLTRGY